MAPKGRRVRLLLTGIIAFVLITSGYIIGELSSTHHGARRRVRLGPTVDANVKDDSGASLAVDVGKLHQITEPPHPLIVEEGHVKKFAKDALPPNAESTAEPPTTTKAAAAPEDGQPDDAEAPAATTAAIKPFVSGKRSSLSSEETARKNVVVAAVSHSIRSYRKHAWGHDEFFPGRLATNNWGGGKGIGCTIIDALDTLILAGLDKEVTLALDWVENTLTFDQSIKLSVFETTIRVLGGLLSAYDLTGRPRLLSLAKNLAERLAPTFKTPSGLPDNYVNIKTGDHEGARWNGGASILSEFGSLQMEFRALSHHQKTKRYRDLAVTATDKIAGACANGMCPRQFLGLTPSGGAAGLGSFGDSYYEYLLKQWILAGPDAESYKKRWLQAADHILATSMETSDGFFIPNGKETGGTMEHLACFSGGLFALSYKYLHKKEHLVAAERIAETCHLMYNSTQTKLAPDVAHFDANRPGREFSTGDPKYILRPETVETYFYLWRVTHNQKYRDWGFEVMEAINKYLKVENGYVGAHDVHKVPPPVSDNMETFWLAETCKYLLLLFSHDDVVDLDQFVFNTEAHPFRIFASASPFGKKAAAGAVDDAPEKIVVTTAKKSRQGKATLPQHKKKDVLELDEEGLAE